MPNAISFQKIGHFFYKHNIPVIPKIIYHTTYLIFNSSLPPSTEIGKNTRLAYGGIGVVVHADMKIGNNVMIGQNVTLGGNFSDKKSEIGDNVYIGAGSRIVGSYIGNNVVIGVNSVISNKVIPNNVVIAGVPARIIGKYDPTIHKWGENL